MPAKGSRWACLLAAIALVLACNSGSSYRSTTAPPPPVVPPAPTPPPPAAFASFLGSFTIQGARPTRDCVVQTIRHASSQQYSLGLRFAGSAADPAGSSFGTDLVDEMGSCPFSYEDHHQRGLLLDLYPVCSILRAAESANCPPDDARGLYLAEMKLPATDLSNPVANIRGPGTIRIRRYGAPALPDVVLDVMFDLRNLRAPIPVHSGAL